MLRTTLDRRFLTLLLGAGALCIAACANPDRVTGKNPGGSLVIRSEGDTTATTDTLVVGDREWLQVVGADTTATITWSVSDSSIVSIVERYFYRVQVSAVRAGTATVTANYEGKSGTFQVVARDSRPSDNELDRIQITTPLKDTATVGDSVPFGFNLWNGRGDPMFGVPFQLILSDTTLARTRGMGDEHSFWIYLTNAGTLTVTVRAGDTTASAEILVRPVIVDPAPSGYEVIDLGTLGGGIAVPQALNDNGQVVGYSTTAGGVAHAFLWENDSMRDLGVSAEPSYAQVITNSGVIAGTTSHKEFSGQAFVWNSGVTTMLGSAVNEVNVVGMTASTVLTTSGDWEHGPRSAVWQNGAWQRLGGLSSGGYSIALAINTTGQIAGTSPVGTIASSYIFHAFVWENGVMRDLGVLADPPCADSPTRNCGQAVAVDLNNNGDVVGHSSDSLDRFHAVLWPRGGAIRDLDLGRAVAINEAGEVAGDAGNGAENAFFWRQGNLTRLPSLGGRTFVADMNDLSMVIGSSVTAQGKSHVFVWQPGRGALLDLGAGPSGDAATAVAINARGDIIGYTCHTSVDGFCSQGASRAILWRVKP